MQYFLDLLVVGISIGMVYGLVALGISLIFSGLDIIHFAHGEIYMLGAFVGLTIAQLTGLNYVVTLLLAEYGYVIRDGVVHMQGPAGQMIGDRNLQQSYLGGTIAGRQDVASPRP